MGEPLVCFHGWNVKSECFSLTLDLVDLSSLAYPERKTVIFEARMLAVAAALEVWREVIHALFFT